MDAPTLFDERATVPDPRRRDGQRHPLSAILSMVALAMLMGRTRLAGIARFGRQFGPSLAFALGFSRGKTPSLSTFSRTLAALDAAAVETVLARGVAARLDPADAEHLSLDGKTRRGSRDGDGPGVHRVAAFAPHAQAVLARIRVDAKTTSTRPPWNSWESCRWPARRCSATPCSASETWPRRSSIPAAMTCWWSRTTRTD